MTPVNNFAPVVRVDPLSVTASQPVGAESGSAPDFRSTLQEAIRRVEASGAAASEQMEQFMAGASADLHNVALATQKASLEFELLMQVRNKVVSAYQEIMRLQI